MDIKSDIFDLDGVRDYEKHLARFSAQEQSERLKIFINKAGIIRRLLPSTSNENKLLFELNRLMERPLSEETIAETKRLLAEDRRERLLKNCKLIFQSPVRKPWRNFFQNRERDNR